MSIIRRAKRPRTADVNCWKCGAPIHAQGAVWWYDGDVARCDSCKVVCRIDYLTRGAWGTGEDEEVFEPW